MLEPTQIFGYIAALALAAAIPGPGMTALVARSVSGGATCGFAMLVGLIVGDLCYLSFAVFGLAILAKSFGIFFVLVKWGAGAYLCYLAWQFWKAQHQPLHTSQASTPKNLLSAGLSGLTITLGNPKTIAFYLALLPVVIDIEKVTTQTWALMLIPLTIVVLLCVGAVFIIGAIGVRHLLSSVKAQRYLHRGAATAMLVAAGAMLVKES